MRITIAGGPTYPIPAVRGGAMAKAWGALAVEFARRGHAVTVVTCGAPHPAGGDKVRYVQAWGYPQSRSVWLDLAKGAVYAARALALLPRADVVVTNDFWLPAVLPRVRPSAGRVFVSAARFPRRQYALYGRCERIVALSSSVAAAIAAQAPRMQRKTTVIPLPVRFALLDAAAARAAPRSRRTLQYIGRLHPEKGVHVLIAAFGRMAGRFPDWDLRIVGPHEAGDGGGGARYLQELQALATGLRVEFAGPVFDEAALCDVYASADLLCYPSLADRGEAFGVVPLESMAAGVPAVVSGLACFTDFIADGVNGWVFDHRGANPAEALADVLAAAMANDEERARRGALGREVAARHSIERVADRYLEEFALP